MLVINSPAFAEPSPSGLYGSDLESGANTNSLLGRRQAGSYACAQQLLNSMLRSPTQRCSGEHAADCLRVSWAGTLQDHFFSFIARTLNHGGPSPLRRLQVKLFCYSTSVLTEPVTWQMKHLITGLCPLGFYGLLPKIVEVTPAKFIWAARVNYVQKGEALWRAMDLSVTELGGWVSAWFPSVSASLQSMKGSKLIHPALSDSLSLPVLILSPLACGTRLSTQRTMQSTDIDFAEL